MTTLLQVLVAVLALICALNDKPHVGIAGIAVGLILVARVLQEILVVHATAAGCWLQRNPRP